MFSEILKIIPKLDGGAMNQMEQGLASRFGRVAKKFGNGLKNVLLGGGIVGAGLAIVDKLLNPLKETQEAIDRYLGRANDISVQAKQFGSTSGELRNLQAVAGAKGITAENLETLLIKYQTALAEAKADPTKQTSVRQYANDTNIVESFFGFIQELKKVNDPSKQVLVQQEVFGEKQIGRMSEFLNTEFSGLIKDLKLPKATELTGVIEKSSNLADLQQMMTERNKLKDDLIKGDIIKEYMVRSKDASDQRKAEQENKNIAGYADLKRLADASDLLQMRLEDLMRYLLKNAPVVADKVERYFTGEKLTQSQQRELVDGIKQIANSKFLRDAVKKGDK